MVLKPIRAEFLWMKKITLLALAVLLLAAVGCQSGRYGNRGGVYDDYDDDYGRITYPHGPAGTYPQSPFKGYPNYQGYPGSF